MKKITFYTLEISDSAKEEIREKYGRGKKVSENIINLLNDILNSHLQLGIKLYDYVPVPSKTYRAKIKDGNIKITELFGKYLDVRVNRDGTTFRKSRTKKRKLTKEKIIIHGIPKHYRFKPEFFRKHGIKIIKNEKNIQDITKENLIITPKNKLENFTIKNLEKIELSIDLDSLKEQEIEKVFRPAALDKFNSNIRITENKVIGFNKSTEYDLTFDKKDLKLYEHFESKIGAYRIFNSLNIFKNKKKDAKQSDFNHRLHHTLLELPKESLRFLRVDGEPLCEIDMKNSQPNLLLNLLVYNKPKIPATHYNLLKEYNIILQQITDKHKKVITSFKNSHRYKKLLAAAHNGKFYEYIQEITELVNNREEAKLIVMLILFSGFNSFNKYTTKWKDLFPRLFFFIREFKKGAYAHIMDKDPIFVPKYIRNKKNEYEASTSVLPVILQKVEAFIFLDNIFSYLLKKDLYALPKHDSIVCKQSDFKTIYNIIIKILNTLLGINKYKLSYSKYNNNNINNNNIAA